MKTKIIFLIAPLALIFANCSNSESNNKNENNQENTAEFYEVKSTNFKIQLPSSLVKQNTDESIFFEALNEPKIFTFQIQILSEMEFKKSEWYKNANNDSLSLLENFHNYATGLQYEKNDIIESRQKFTQFGTNEGLDTQMTIGGEPAADKISILSFQAKTDLVFFYFKYPSAKQKDLKNDFSEIMRSFTVI